METLTLESSVKTHRGVVLPSVHEPEHPSDRADVKFVHADTTRQILLRVEDEHLVKLNE